MQVWSALTTVMKANQAGFRRPHSYLMMMMMRRKMLSAERELGVAVETGSHRVCVGPGRLRLGSKRGRKEKDGGLRGTSEACLTFPHTRTGMVFPGAVGEAPLKRPVPERKHLPASSLVSFCSFSSEPPVRSALLSLNHAMFFYFSPFKCWFWTRLTSPGLFGLTGGFAACVSLCPES